MENLKSWAVCVVASAAVAAVIELLSPEGGSEKPVKFITGVFVLFAFASPFANFEPLHIDYIQGVEDYVESHKLQKQIELQARNSLEAQINSMLSSYVEGLGAVCEGVEAEVVINSEKDIYLDAITVYIADADEETKRKIAEYSKESFGVAPEIKARE